MPFWQNIILYVFNEDSRSSSVNSTKTTQLSRMNYRMKAVYYSQDKWRIIQLIIDLGTGCCCSRCSLHLFLQVDNLECGLNLEILRGFWRTVRLPDFEEHPDEINFCHDGGQAERHEGEVEPWPGGLRGQGEQVVAKHHQVDPAIAEPLDDVILWKKLDKFFQLEIEPGEERDCDDVIEEWITEDDPGHNKISLRKSDLNDNDDDNVSVLITSLTTNMPPFLPSEWVTMWWGLNTITSM